jgi:hypothetical protein
VRRFLDFCWYPFNPVFLLPPHGIELSFFIDTSSNDRYKYKISSQFWRIVVAFNATGHTQKNHEARFIFILNQHFVRVILALHDKTIGITVCVKRKFF